MPNMEQIGWAQRFGPNYSVSVSLDCRNAEKGPCSFNQIRSLESWLQEYLHFFSGWGWAAADLQMCWAADIKLDWNPISGDISPAPPAASQEAAWLGFIFLQTGYLLSYL